MVRKPVVAGKFYPADKTELEKEVRGFLEPKKSGKSERIIGAIVPHAGYDFSGKCAGKVYSKLPKFKTFIIISVNHTGIGNRISFSLQDFSTPLGVVKNNKILGEKILNEMQKTNLEADVSETVHANEHSIEVQLPFLQVTQKDFNIVPIILSALSYTECKKIADILEKFLTKDILIIASSDFTHYGISYGFMPFTTNVKENLYKLDKNIIDEILKLDSKGFYEKASQSTVCGIFAVTILTEIAKLKGWKAKLLDYYTSGDVLSDWTNAVGYAGIVFD